MTDRIQQLTRLGRLRDAGALSSEEFEREKAAILAQHTNAPGPGRVPLWVGVLLASALIFAAWLVYEPRKASVPEELNRPAASTETAGLPVQRGQTAAVAAAQPVAKQPSPIVAEAASQSAPPKVGSRCRIQIADRSYLDGPCAIDLSEDGSFTVFQNRGGAGYFAMVIRDGPTAKGYWNGSPDSAHAHDELGELRREGACWKNERAEICAWS